MIAIPKSQVQRVAPDPAQAQQFPLGLAQANTQVGEELSKLGGRVASVATTFARQKAAEEKRFKNEEDIRHARRAATQIDVLINKRANGNLAKKGDDALPAADLSIEGAFPGVTADLMNYAGMVMEQVMNDMNLPAIQRVLTQDFMVRTLGAYQINASNHEESQRRDARETQDAESLKQIHRTILNHFGDPEALDVGLLQASHLIASQPGLSGDTIRRQIQEFEQQTVVDVVDTVAAFNANTAFQVLFQNRQKVGEQEYGAQIKKLEVKRLVQFGADLGTQYVEMYEGGVSETDVLKFLALQDLPAQERASVKKFVTTSIKGLRSADKARREKEVIGAEEYIQQLIIDGKFTLALEVADNYPHPAVSERLRGFVIARRDRVNEATHWKVFNQFSTMAVSLDKSLQKEFMDEELGLYQLDFKKLTQLREWQNDLRMGKPIIPLEGGDYGDAEKRGIELAGFNTTSSNPATIEAIGQFKLSYWALYRQVLEHKISKGEPGYLDTLELMKIATSLAMKTVDTTDILPWQKTRRFLLSQEQRLNIDPKTIESITDIPAADLKWLRSEWQADNPFLTASDEALIKTYQRYLYEQAGEIDEDGFVTPQFGAGRGSPPS